MFKNILQLGYIVTMIISTFLVIVIFISKVPCVKVSFFAHQQYKVFVLRLKHLSNNHIILPNDTFTMH